MSSNGRLQGHVALLALACLLVVCVVRFALVQDIWLDESTQLSGMTLAPWEVVRWLAGEGAGRFGVPDDRMPPVSYALDWMWSSAFAGSVLSIRLFHAGVAILGVLVLAWTVAHRIGTATAVALLALFVLSTRFVQTAVEIRAYPLYLGFVCLLLALHLRLAGGGRRVACPAMVAYAALGVLLTWTHFFGVVAYCALATGLLWHCRADRRSLLVIVAASFVVVIAAGALQPFINASVQSSGTVPAPVGLVDIARYFAQLVAGSIELLWPAGAAVLFAGVAALLLAAATALLPAAADSGQPGDGLLVSVIVALAAGIAVTVATAFVAQGFSPLKMSYSTWTLPLLFFVIAAGWNRAVSARWWRSIGRHVALGLVLVGMGTAAAALFAKPALFAHGPRRFLEQQWMAAGNAPIIYETEGWGWAYFPLRYTGKGLIPQWRLVDAVVPSIERLADLPAKPQPIPLAVAVQGERRVVLVGIRMDTYAQLRSYLRGGETRMEPGPLGQWFAANGDWELEDVREMPGYYSSRAWTWRRKSAANAASEQMPAQGNLLP